MRVTAVALAGIVFAACGSDDIPGKADVVVPHSYCTEGSDPARCELAKCLEFIPDVERGGVILRNTCDEDLFQPIQGLGRHSGFWIGAWGDWPVNIPSMETRVSEPFPGPGGPVRIVANATERELQGFAIPGPQDSDELYTCDYPREKVPGDAPLTLTLTLHLPVAEDGPHWIGECAQACPQDYLRDPADFPPSCKDLPNYLIVENLVTYRPEQNLGRPKFESQFNKAF